MDSVNEARILERVQLFKYKLVLEEVSVIDSLLLLHGLRVVVESKERVQVELVAHHDFDQILICRANNAFVDVEQIS